jgi:glycerophosphoryl diester phosphodiesterase
MPRQPGAFERIGHRGAPRESPENTIPSFQRALELGADAIELDVHATADGVVVVHHDPKLGAIAGPAARGRPIAGMSWAELSTIELAAGIGVPTLGQVLELAAGRAMVYVEIKGVGIERLVLETVRAARGACAVHSFDHAQIARARAIDPGIRRGILFDRYPLDLEASMRDAGALDVWPKRTLIDRALVETAHASSGRVIAWTVNSAAHATRLLALGVDGICTDDLRVLQSIP